MIKMKGVSCKIKYFLFIGDSDLDKNISTLAINTKSKVVT